MADVTHGHESKHELPWPLVVVKPLKVGVLEVVACQRKGSVLVAIEVLSLIRPFHQFQAITKGLGRLAINRSLGGQLASSRR